MPEISTVPCDLHEITNCSVCTGLDKQLAAEDEPEPLTWTGVVADVVGPGDLRAKWPGNCAHCGRRYDAGEIIRFDKEHNGWVTPRSCG